MRGICSGHSIKPLPRTSVAPPKATADAPMKPPITRRAIAGSSRTMTSGNGSAMLGFSQMRGSASLAHHQSTRHAMDQATPYVLRVGCRALQLSDLRDRHLTPEVGHQLLARPR